MILWKLIQNHFVAKDDEMLPLADLWANLCSMNFDSNVVIHMG